MTKMTKKGEMGVGTLIVFIAMLLVAAVAAGVLIQTAGSLQEKSLSTGQQAESQISTNARVIEVSASDGRGGNLTEFQQLVKLSPGSDPIKLSQIIFTFNTEDKTSTLKYRGTDSVCLKNNVDGYNTLNEEEFDDIENFAGLTVTAPVSIQQSAWDSIELDLDDDGTDDRVAMCDDICPAGYNATHLVFNLTTDGLVFVRVLNDNGTLAYLNETGAAGSSNGAFKFSHLNISTYGYISGSRDAGTNAYEINFIDTNIDMQFFENPVELAEDLDDDNKVDKLAVGPTYATLLLSSNVNATVSLGADISAPTTLSGSATLANDSVTYGTLTMSGQTYTADIIPKNATFKLTPYREGEGYFSVEYEQEGTNHVDGNLQRGDIIKICYESPEEIVEDAQVRLNFIPKTGTPTLTQFVSPDVISTERVYLYP